MAPAHSPAQLVVDTVRSDPSLLERVLGGANPAVVVREAVKPVQSEAAWPKDKGVFRIAIAVLGALVGLCARQSGAD